MRIGINLLYLIPGIVGGTETYARELLHAMADLDRNNEYVIYVNKESANLKLPDVTNMRRVVCPIVATRRPLRYAWEQFVLPWQLLKDRIDVVHSLGYVSPLVTHCPRVVTIHDLNFIFLKENLPSSKVRFLSLFSTWSAKCAAKIITVSRFSKEQLKTCLEIVDEKICVTHEGPCKYLLSEPPEALEELQNHYSLHGPYIMAIAGGSRHKNIPRLIEAFGMIAGEHPHQLVLAGNLPQGLDVAAESARSSISSRVAVLGYLPKSHLISLMSHADLFVIPSLYEGFGLTVLEAQEAGAPVACSTAASLPEVAGDGALYFDPLSVGDMADTIGRCLADLSLRDGLRQRGEANLSRFSWAKAAQETLDVYFATVGQERSWGSGN